MFITAVDKCIYQPLSRVIGKARRVGLVGESLGGILGRF